MTAGWGARGGARGVGRAGRFEKGVQAGGPGAVLEHRGIDETAGQLFLYVSDQRGQLSKTNGDAAERTSHPPEFGQGPAAGKPGLYI